MIYIVRNGFQAVCKKLVMHPNDVVIGSLGVFFLARSGNQEAVSLPKSKIAIVSLTSNQSGLQMKDKPEDIWSTEQELKTEIKDIQYTVSTVYPWGANL